MSLRVSRITRRASLQAAFVCALTAPKRVLADVAPTLSPSNELWTLGDSTAQSMGEAIAHLLKGDALKTRNLFRNSSGLTRPDFFDWPKTVKPLIAARAPVGLVLSFGANDTQGLFMASEKRVAQLGTPEWGDEYAKRVRSFVDLFTDKGTEAFILGQPFDPTRKYAPLMRAVNDAFKKAAQDGQRTTYIDAEGILADAEGHFQKTTQDSRGKTITLRNDDGIHMTSEGARFLAIRVLEIVKKKLEK